MAQSSPNWLNSPRFEKRREHRVPGYTAAHNIVQKAYGHFSAASVDSEFLGDLGVEQWVVTAVVFG